MTTEFVQLNATFWVRPSSVDGYWEDSANRCHIIVNGCKQDLVISLADLQKALAFQGPVKPAFKKTGWWLTRDSAGNAEDCQAVWKLRIYHGARAYEVVATFIGSKVATFPVYKGEHYPLHLKGGCDG